MTRMFVFPVVGLFIVMTNGCRVRSGFVSGGRRPLPTGEVTRIAFGSCAKHWLHQPILDTVIAAKPDLWLYLGDAIYADTDGKTAWTVTEKTLQGEWNRLADKPEFKRLRARVPMMAVWDNHDYGTHQPTDKTPTPATRFLGMVLSPAGERRMQIDGGDDATLRGRFRAEQPRTV